MKSQFIIVTLFVSLSTSFVSGNNLAVIFNISPSDVKEIAVYKVQPGTSEILKPDQINFNITSPLLIDSMITAIEFTTERDGSTLGSHTLAYVYIRFKDNSIAIYELFALWNHICKVGQRSSCYYITKVGSKIFQKHAQ